MKWIYNIILFVVYFFFMGFLPMEVSDSKYFDMSEVNSLSVSPFKTGTT